MFKREFKSDNEAFGYGIRDGFIIVLVCSIVGITVGVLLGGLV